MDGAVLRMRVPLIDLRQQVAAVRGQVAAAPAALEAGLKRRTDAAKAREALELLLDTANVLSKASGGSSIRPALRTGNFHASLSCYPYLWNQSTSHHFVSN